MFCKLRRQMLCSSRADEYRALNLVHGSFAARKLDDELTSTPHLTREPLVWRHAVGPIEQVELVVARCLQVLEYFAYHDPADGSGEHTAAIVRDIDALP